MSFNADLTEKTKGNIQQQNYKSSRPVLWCNYNSLLGTSCQKHSGVILRTKLGFSDYINPLSANPTK